jgi:hypothetical protein
MTRRVQIREAVGPDSPCGRPGRLSQTLQSRARLFLFGTLPALIFFAALLVPSAQGGPPIHFPLGAAENIEGLNHACGVAVDSEGDVYVSSAGESKIKVFDEAHTELTSITDTHEPCGVAVDSQGSLYVSEGGTGDVVRFTPSTFPFIGTPIYGSAEPIDTTGNAKGISLDRTNDRLYVAEGGRVSVFDPDGSLVQFNESQRVRVGEGTTGGTFTLKFGTTSPTTTVPIAFGAKASKSEQASGSVEEALEGLGDIGPGDIEVGQLGIAYLVTFKGALAHKDVEPIVGDPSGLTPSGTISVTESTKGFNGHIGEGELTDATGVAAYTYRTDQRYVFVAEPSQEEIKIYAGPSNVAPKFHGSIDGSETPAGELGLASTGAYLGVDPENGHVFSFDATHAVVNEFEATGRYFTQIDSPEPPFSFEDAEPTAIAVDRSGGPGDGTVYVTTGTSSGAKALTFEAVADPSRPSFGKPLSHEFKGACGTVVDSHGDLYVAGESVIRIYRPSGTEVTHIEDPGKPCYLAVDSEGNLYAVDFGTSNSGDEKVALYEPGIYPPQSGTTYTERTPIEEPPGGSPGIAVDPTDDHLFVSHSESLGVLEYKSAKEGSGLLVSGFCGFGSGSGGIDVYGVNGDVYIASGSEITVCDSSGNVLTRIDGSGSRAGVFGDGTMNVASLAVDQANGHVLVSDPQFREEAEEYEASGAFVAGYGSFTSQSGRWDVAIDNACALHEPPLVGSACESFDPANGNLYLAYDEPTGFDLTTFGPLNYGEAPVATTGIASGISGSGATLNGTVDPRGFELEECTFEWGKAENAFEPEEPCAESPGQIGQGVGSVSVHRVISGITPETTRYRFRLRAKNRFGESEGEEGIFGPPLVTTKTAQPIFYREATLHGEVDSSGLETKYHFEYLTQAEYEASGESFAAAKSTSTRILPASSGGSTAVEAPLTGLAEGTAYRFRLVAANEAAIEDGLNQGFETLEKLHSPSCPNETLRLENNSTNLSNCRAYELVTPADTQGAAPIAAGPGAASDRMFNNWLVTPSGPLAGESLAFFVDGTLPGFEGNGGFDAYRATRGPTGWSTRIFSPTLAQGGHGLNLSGRQHGLASDQLYSFWDLRKSPGASLASSTYLRTPERFEALGQGTLGTDPNAEGHFISSSAVHVIFSSAVQLEDDAGNEAAPSGTTAIYDRAAGSSKARVISLKPDGSAFDSGENATYQGATEDGSSVVFSVGNDLYLRRNDTETVKVVDVAVNFAGVSVNGERVFYESGGGLYVCDIAVGPCVGGSEPPGRFKIATTGKFVDVSADGSHAYFTSEEKIGGEGVLGQHNLYVWVGGGTKFIVALDPTDMFHGGQKHFPGTSAIDEFVALDSWTAQCVREGVGGRADCPSRTTPDGRFLVFQSHADLTPYEEGHGHSEIYRYDSEDGSLVCVSCDPSGAPATAESDLQPIENPAPAKAQTLIPNVTDDGKEIVFQTTAQLLPEDGNSVLDAYEWLADGTGGCARPNGCLALISSGQGDTPSYIYSMTPDGHDVFFRTTEKLIGSDVAGSPSVYDARVGGGFPQPVEPEPCHGDACQPLPGPAPERSTAATGIPNPGNEAKPQRRRCPKGKRLVRKGGKAHCAKRHSRAKAHNGAGHRGGGGR